MTMTSVAFGPPISSPAAIMIGPKRYYPQQSLDTAPPAASPGKCCYADTLSKGKKSWSVRLGLSRGGSGSSRHVPQAAREQQKQPQQQQQLMGYSTVSAGSGLAQKMAYEQWLYSTVRGHQPSRLVPAGLATPVLIVCSCLEFPQHGTTSSKSLRSQCRKCGGHRLPAYYVGGGTCRLPAPSAKSRPSLAGMLLSGGAEDPYEQMRRNRLAIEPRSRARSTSPLRQLSQRDVRSQSVVAGRCASSASAPRNLSGVEPMSMGTEWFVDCELADGAARDLADGADRVDAAGRDNRESSLGLSALRSQPPVGHLEQRSSELQSKSVRGWQALSKLAESEKGRSSGNASSESTVSRLALGSDSRKSILECDVNPYLLLLDNQPHEDDQRGESRLSCDDDDDDDDDDDNDDDDDDDDDTLSENAFERELLQSFDPSKVKSIERTPTSCRNSVAAIGGQRVRLFNEPPMARESSIEQEEQQQPPLTRIPIPKISPKRPPRRIKTEAKRALKSILKRADRGGMFVATEGKRKSVQFMVDNAILAPEKSVEMWTCSGGGGSGSSTHRRLSLSSKCDDLAKSMESESLMKEAPIMLEETSLPQQHYRSVRIANNTKSMNLSKPQQQPFQCAPTASSTPKLPEAKILPRCSKSVQQQKQPSIDRIKIDNIVPSKKQELQPQHETANRRHYPRQEVDQTSARDGTGADQEKRQETLQDKDHVQTIVTVDKCKVASPASPRFASQPGSKCLIRSQSERLMSARPETWPAASVNFVDTMRLSLCRKSKDEEEEANQPVRETIWPRRDHFGGKKIFEEAGKEVATLRVSMELNPGVVECHVPRTEEEKVAAAAEATGHEEKTTSLVSPTSQQSLSSLRPTTTHGDDEQFESDHANVCQITILPKIQPTCSLSRPEIEARSTRTMLTRNIRPHGTCITINHRSSGGNSSSGERNLDGNNRVTISVGGDSRPQLQQRSMLYNPMVISVNGKATESTLLPSENQQQQQLQDHVTGDQKGTLILILDKNESDAASTSSSSVDWLSEVRREADADKTAQSTLTSIRTLELSSDDSLSPPSSPPPPPPPTPPPRWKAQMSNPTQEEMTSKLLDGSLRKSRENNELLNDSSSSGGGSGETILNILKHGLSKRPSTPQELDSTKVFFVGDDGNAGGMEEVENQYEVIKEPIYEEISDEPPPLPLCPPPSETDFRKHGIFYGGALSCCKDNFNYAPLNDESARDDGNDAGLEFLECSSCLSSTTTRRRNSTRHSDGSGNGLVLSEGLFYFIMDSEKHTCSMGGNLQRQPQVDDDRDLEEVGEQGEEEDPERDLEVLYEQQKAETSLGDLSSKSSQISNVSADRSSSSSSSSGSSSSEECNIVQTNSKQAPKTRRTVGIERTDSGVGSESSQASSGRGGGVVARRWRTAYKMGHDHEGRNNRDNNDKTQDVAEAASTQIGQMDAIQCEDCEQGLETAAAHNVDSALQRSTMLCRKCGKKRAERKEIITEIVETEQKYGRDLQIILDEFHRPMLRAGLLTLEQLSAIFLNVEELLEHNRILADRLKDALHKAQEGGDVDLVSVDLGKIFLDSERMLHAFESYCTRQGGASLLLQNLEKEKELLRIFLKVSQMENTVLRRMNLNSFLMVPVQRVTKYPLLLARLQKATPSNSLSGRPDMQELKKRLKQAQTNIELHLEHMNAEAARDVTSTRLWRRISITQQQQDQKDCRRSSGGGEQELVNMKLRKMAVEVVLKWPYEDSRFVLEGRLLVAQPTDNNWARRAGKTVKLCPVIAMLVTNNNEATSDQSEKTNHIKIDGKPANNVPLATVASREFPDLASANFLFARQIGRSIKHATLLLLKEKLGRYSLLREPLHLDKCIVCSSETDAEDYFEIQELSTKETFIFKAEDAGRTRRWCRTLQAHAQSLGAWRRRRGALPNIMICGLARS